MNNPHFDTVPSWAAARAKLDFQPLRLRDTAGYRLLALRIFVRDHKRRELAVADRELEAYFGSFVFSQPRKGATEARRQAVEMSYGRSGRTARVGGCEARAYERGPEPAPDDIDGRSPAVVTWPDGDMLYLLASGELSSDELLRIAGTIYA